jgi:Transcription factor TFIID (or TATA-binding protein, TBP)
MDGLISGGHIGANNGTGEALQQQAVAEATTVYKSGLAIVTDPQNSHRPSAAGSVIETADGLSGGTLLIRIQNITATANLGVRLDLKKIALKCRNTEFNPRRYVMVTPIRYLLFCCYFLFLFVLFIHVFC